MVSLPAGAYVMSRPAMPLACHAQRIVLKIISLLHLPFSPPRGFKSSVSMAAGGSSLSRYDGRDSSESDDAHITHPLCRKRVSG